MKACVEDCTVNRSTGGTALVPIDPSNLRITELKMSEERQAFLGEILRRKNEVKRRFGLVETKE
ncbi:hypothetical protein ECANGB1_1004 [Enterospora canceri]|uniref:Uncharacterized protein n=1 Tax=Enterospora canceri TaxID=1081671 RepID=A0A1Y1S877_9MICR|nr:hypothetical protein ECANGB1_1004 [Enterospora canceri]